MRVIQFLKGGSWIKWAISFCVLLISVLISFAGTQRNLFLIAIMVAFIVVVMVLLKWPGLGLLGILFAGYFVNFTGPGGINAIVIGVVGMVGVWLVDMVIQKRHIYFAEPRTTRAVFAFLASGVISFLVGQISWYPLASHAPLTAQVGGLMILGVSGLSFLLVSNAIDGLHWLKALTWMFVIIGSLYTIGRMIPPVAHVLRLVFADGAFVGSLFFVWILVISFSQALLNRELPPLLRVLLFLLFLGVLYVSIVQASDWKSGYIPPLAGVAIIIVLILKEKTVWLTPFLFIGAYAILYQAVASDEYSMMTRLQAWEIVCQLGKISPIFGLGFSNYYWYTPLIPINGWQVNFSSHSQYVDLFAQTGILGLFCFFWIFWEIARIGLKILDKVPDGFCRAYIYGALGGLGGTLIAGLLVDWVLPFVYNIGTNGMRSSILSWFFLGGVIVIFKLTDNESESNETGTLLGGKND